MHNGYITTRTVSKVCHRHQRQRVFRRRRADHIYAGHHQRRHGCMAALDAQRYLKA